MKHTGRNFQKLIFNSAIAPPDPIAERYVNEIYIDTTGYSIGNRITEISVDGTPYPAGAYGFGAIGGASVDSTSWADSILTALLEHGLDPNEFYTWGYGGGGNQVYFGMVHLATHTIGVRWLDGNGNSFATNLVPRTQVNENWFTNYVGNTATDSVVYYTFQSPVFGGGSISWNVFGGFSIVDFIMSDFQTLPNSIYYALGALNPNITPVQNGGVSEITFSLFYFPVTAVGIFDGVATNDRFLNPV